MEKRRKQTPKYKKSHKQYAQSEKGKEARKQYTSTEKYKEERREKDRIRNQKTEVKIRKHEYKNTPEYKEYIRRYAQNRRAATDFFTALGVMETVATRWPIKQPIPQTPPP